MAKPVDEEAHFRIDEMERRFETLKPKVEGVLDMMVIHAVMEAVKTTFAPLQAAIERDANKDTDVAQRLEGLETSVGRLESVMLRMCECLERPKNRTLTAHLPSGPVTVTTTEVH